MKNSTIFSLATILLIGFQWELHGQVTLEHAQDFADSTQMVEGSSLQQGGSFTDPVANQGLSLSSDLNLSQSKQVFGSDALTLNAKWVPGSNKIGSRIYLNLGTANWFTPALSEVYPDTVLSLEERFQESTTQPNWIAGLGVTLLRPDEVTDEDFKPFKQRLDALATALLNAENDSIQQKINEEEEQKILWEISRQQARKPRWSVGSNFRLVELGESANIDVFDFFTSFARGKGIWDFNGALHYVAPRQKSLVLQNAVKASAGCFIDLNDLPPMMTLAAIFSYGHYNFREKSREYIADPNEPSITLRNQPFVNTFDVTLAFSGLRGSSIFGSGIGFKYSVRWNPNFEKETQFAILFTSKFVKERK